MAYCWFTNHRDLVTISISRSGSPTRVRIWAVTFSSSRSGSPAAMSKPQPAIHWCQGWMARSRPIPISPKPALELKIQCRMLGRCST